jgi:hypothetical protein
MQIFAVFGSVSDANTHHWHIQLVQQAFQCGAAFEVEGFAGVLVEGRTAPTATDFDCQALLVRSFAAAP